MSDKNSDGLSNFGLIVFLLIGIAVIINAIFGTFELLASGGLGTLFGLLIVVVGFIFVVEALSKDK